MDIKEEPAWPLPLDACVKRELDTETDICIKEEWEAGSNLPDAEEAAWDNCVGVSEAATQAGLYTDHLVKNEMVFGPELVQPQAKSHAVAQTSGKILKQEQEQGDTESRPELQDCYVRLEYMSIDKLCKKRTFGTKRNAKDVSKSTVTTSQTTSEVKIYICNDCGERYEKRTLFINHLKKHVSGNLYKCDKCVKVYADTVDLTRHSLMHNMIDKKTKCCYSCNKQFVSRTALINHIRKHLGQTTCKVCHKEFSTRGSLARHKLIHTGTYPFICDTCGQRYRYKDNLIWHIHNHTRQQFQRKTISCDICKKQFSHTFHLDNHRRSHTGEKPYQCETCQRSFSAKNNLKKHILTHMKNRPFPCDLCTKQFCRKDNLIAHKRSHTGEKPFACGICEKTFSIKRCLVTHLNVHTGGSRNSSNRSLKLQSCDVCEKTFTTKTKLTIHKRIHTGDKPYTCEICKKSFRHDTTLASHFRTHTGERPYGCDMCKLQFTTNSNLLAHKRRAH